MTNDSGGNHSGGLRPEDLVIGCVARNEPGSLAGAVRLVDSVRRFGGALERAEVVVCVLGGIDGGALRAIEEHGAEVRLVPASGLPDRWRFLAEAEELDAEHLLHLDVDAVVVADPRPFLPSAPLAAVRWARADGAPAVSPEALRALGLADIGPIAPHGETFGGGGALLVSKPVASRLAPALERAVAKLAAIPSLAGILDEDRNALLLRLAMDEIGVAGTPLPPELDFRLEATPPAASERYAVDPAILRTGSRVDADGLLDWSPYPFPQVRIEAWNRHVLRRRSGIPTPRRPSPPPVPTEPPVRTFVLGMHRTGTSVLTALLGASGFHIGDEDDFPPADLHNERGYFEHRSVWSIDEAILLALSRTWCEVASLDLGKLPDPLRMAFRERARTLVAELDRHGSWAVKDPRLGLVFGLWREVVEAPFCILLTRSPLAVARSLSARDGFPIPFGIALAEAYTRRALAASEGAPRILVPHRDLVEDPEATLGRIRGAMAERGLDVSRIRVPDRDRIARILDPALIHQKEDSELEREHLTPPQRELERALGDGSALAPGGSGRLSPGAESLLLALERQLAEIRSLQERILEGERTAARLRDSNGKLRAAHEEASLRNDEELRRALEVVDDLDSLFSALLESRTFRLGRGLAEAARFGRPAPPGAIERRAALMAAFDRKRGIPLGSSRP